MKKIAILGLAVGSLSAMALSQTSTKWDPQPTNIGIRGGYIFPLYQALKDISRTYFGVGVDYYFTSRQQGDTFLAFDYIARSLKSQTGSMTLFTYNVKRFWDPSGSDRKYWVVGAGLANQNFTSGNLVFGARYGVGMELNPHISAEVVATYTSPGREKIQGSTAGFYLNYKF